MTLNFLKDIQSTIYGNKYSCIFCALLLLIPLIFVIYKTITGKYLLTLIPDEDVESKPIFSETVSNPLVKKEGFTPSNDDPVVELLLFFADWCPHCKKIIPEWQSITSKYNGQELNGKKVIVKAIDCSETGSPKVNETLDLFKVTGFPTIKILQPNEKVLTLEESPTEDNIIKFLKTGTL